MLGEMTMRRLLGAMTVAILALTPAAYAETLDEVTTRGIVATLSGFDIEVNFTPDNRFSMLGGAIVGAWRIDETRLCLTGDADGIESCTEYPLGKVSGDTFEVQRAEGPMTVRIK
jgi:hypothetical protein